MANMHDNRIRVVIADDHPIFREGLAKVIARDARIRIVAEAEDGAEAIDLLLEHRPEVAVVDIDMPINDGFAVTRTVVDKKLPTRVIILTSHKNEEIFRTALDIGVAGFVLKDGAVTEIVNAIRLVAEGKNYFSPELSTYLLARANRSADFARNKPSINDLTPTERRVLSLIAAEKTSREIAEFLSVSIRTIEHHRAHICDKLDLHGFNAVVRFAIAHRSELS